MRAVSVLMAMVVMTVAIPCWASLTANQVSGGDFETTANLKNWSTTDSFGTHIPVWRWDAENDPGNWIAQWGPWSVCDPDGCTATAGFSTYDNPRDLAIDAAGDNSGFVNQGESNFRADDIGNMNRSYVDTNGDSVADDHVMEAMMFYPRWGQWFVAPENQKPGPINFSFDFRLNEWQPEGTASATVLQAQVFGTHELPAHDVGIWGLGSALQPIDYSGNGLSGDRLVQFNWGSWWNDVWGNPDTDSYAGNDHGWLHVENDGSALWDTAAHGAGGKDDLLTFETTETYEYYAVVFFTRSYHEGNEYFWADSARVTDTQAILVDDVSLKISVQIRGDFNDDGAVNNLDIAPFITALTNLAAYTGSYPAVDLGLVDPNNDGVINNLDIAPFITMLTGGGQAIPEPMTAMLLGVAGLGLLARRR